MKSSNQAPMILSLVLFFALLTGFSNCSQLEIPNGEICFSSKETFGKLICENTLYELGDPRREYERLIGSDINGRPIADVVSNSDQYFKIRADYIETKKKYLICKRHPEQCQ